MLTYMQTHTTPEKQLPTDALRCWYDSPGNIGLCAAFRRTGIWPEKL